MPLIPTSWLAEHVELPADLTAERLAADLVKVGLEEETIHKADVTGPIVVGKVLSLVKEPQKNGKLINYCRVDVGRHNDAPGEGKEPSDLPSRGIICGAHNFVEGDYVVVSLPGAVLPGNFQIAARKTYGHISDGMICSEAELGLGDGHADGIIVLASDGDDVSQIPGVGEDALEFLGLTKETLEINITPDRGYCFSMRGVAREYSHSTGAAFTDPGLPENNTELPQPAGEPSVVIDDAVPIHGVAGCDRFVTRVVRGIDPTAPTPQWMAERLTEAGMRPISLAVDATNYVMLDLGQPLHAYDLGQLQLPITVRRAKPGEKLTTLDDIERTLDGEDLLITDSNATRTLGIAGVMGGADTEVTKATSDVLIEAAHFDQVSIARSARRHKIPSEAAKRFERGVDPLIAPIAAQRVVDILVEYGGGTASDEYTDLNHVEAPDAIEFNPDEVARLTGLVLSETEIRDHLEAIGCSVDGDFTVTPPSWRPDLVGPAYLVEEVARLAGYDRIASIVPAAPAGSGLSLSQRRRRDLVRQLAETGWVEVLSYPFVGRETFDKQGIDADDVRRRALKLTNPLQDEAGLMRTSLLDSLLATASLNVARGNQAVAIFESSLVTEPVGIIPAPMYPGGVRPSDEDLDKLNGALPVQPHHLAGVAVPSAVPSRAGIDSVTWDWRDAVSAVVSGAEMIGARVDRANAARAPFHPGRCAELSVGGTVIGYAGELAPAVCQAFGLPARSIAFEYSTTALFSARGSSALEVRPVLTHPVVKEDFAVVVDHEVTSAELEAVIADAIGDLAEDVSLFDVYVGEQVPEGKKSMAYSVRLRGDHTLDSAEINEVRSRVIKKLESAGASLR